MRCTGGENDRCRASDMGLSEEREKLLKLGKQHLENDEFDLAIEAFTRCVDVSPENGLERRRIS